MMIRIKSNALEFHSCQFVQFVNDKMAKKTTETSTPLPDPRCARTLDQIIGNASVRAFLKRAWKSGKLPQSLLFYGPEGVGKTTTAWALARQIAAGDGDPATHPGALKIERGVHPDVIALTGAGSISATIKVDDVRAIEDRAATSALEAPRKMVLIRPADRMNEAAANCLLKILEEPPPHLVFLLITSEPNRLPTTIRSRCTPIGMEASATDELLPWLMREAGIAEERARLVAALAEGRPGWALRLAQTDILEARGRILEALSSLAKHGFAGVFGVADRLANAGGDLAQTLTMAMTLLRDALVLKTRGAEGILHRDLAEELETLAAGHSLAGLLAASERLERAAAESPYFYTPQARMHFMECVTTDVGRRLRMS